MNTPVSHPSASPTSRAARVGLALLARGMAAAALCLAAGLPAAAQQLYRCDVDGRTTYTDKPCAAGSRQTAVAPAPDIDPADQAAAQARSERLVRQAEAADARRAAEARAEAAANTARAQQLRTDEARSLAADTAPDLEAPIVRRRVIVIDPHNRYRVPAVPQQPAQPPSQPTHRRIQLGPVRSSSAQ
ncbi:DUF4124 domain-containing protein [Derxia gummosa]|uniref:DUF4124 domain-containing protein n=1 Tax=Derxia gummosa DSM 723 TaxID=1121388 RepID=A0A8B6XAD5_9BURK|nr:DUF4124 domain-containing protein [Derxia gummosa]